MGDSVGVASSPIFPCNNSVISSFSRSLGGTLFMALISSGSARNGASCVSSLGGYQRLFAFTGTLALHRWDVPKGFEFPVGIRTLLNTSDTSPPRSHRSKDVGVFLVGTPHRLRCRASVL